MSRHRENTVQTMLAMERAALSRWGRGDPSGYLEIFAPDVTCFDPFQVKRLDGLHALTELYESLRGQIRVDRDEWIAPRVQVCGETAVLTFNLVSYAGATRMHWNCTEVYRCNAGAWQIIHTHWSLTPQGA